MSNEAPVVCDFGSHTTSIGIGGDDAPRSVIPSLVIPDSEGNSSVDSRSGTQGACRKKSACLVGDDAQAELTKREQLSLEESNSECIGMSNGYSKYAPLYEGLVGNWDAFDDLVGGAIADLLHTIRSEKCDVDGFMVVEPMITTRKQQEQLTELMFETHSVPSFYTFPSGLLSLYSSGRTTGVTLDIGEHCTTATAFYESSFLPSSVHRLGYGGAHMTDEALQRLNSASPADSEPRLLTRTVAMNALSSVGGVSNDIASKQEYELPDGTMINTSSFRGIGRSLFDINGYAAHHEGAAQMTTSNAANDIVELVVKSLMAHVDAVSCEQSHGGSTMEDSHRLTRELSQNIILSGGASLLLGLESEFNAQAQKPHPCLASFNGNMNRGQRQANLLRMIAPPERKYSVWIGGSILTSLSTTQSLWIPKSTYDEYGPNVIVHQPSVTFI